MTIASRNQISHYQEAKSNFQSLVKQTCQVGLGFAVMLLVTAGRPSAFGLSVTVGLSMVFVTWSEIKRLSETTLSSSKKSVPEKVLIAPQYVPDIRPPHQENPNLQGVDWQNKNLAYKNLSKVNLSQANLKVVNLCAANLSGSLLIEAKLDFANLYGAILIGTDLTGANLIFANLHGSFISEQTRLDPKWRLVWDILNIDRSERNLNGYDLRAAYLKLASLEKAELVGTDLTGAILEKSDLRQANFEKAILWAANLSGADLRQANLSGADLRQANLSQTNLSGADLRQANLSQTNLTDANVEKTTFWQNEGLSDSLKQELTERGAIVEDLLDNSLQLITT
jgi:uncharacterized protein YjbI with pentapeptide repeats